MVLPSNVHEDGGMPNGLIGVPTIRLKREIKPQVSPAEKNLQLPPLQVTSTLESIAFHTKADLHKSQSSREGSAKQNVSQDSGPKQLELITSRRKGLSDIELLAYPPEKVICDQDDDGDNELMMSIMKRLELYVCLMIRVLIKQHKTKLLNLQNSLGQTALHLAVLTESVVILEYLVEAGADPDIRDRHGNTALHCACQLGHLEQVKVITNHMQSRLNGQSMKIKQTKANFLHDEKGRLMPVHLAELQNYKGLNCLHLAVLNGHADVVKHLVTAVGLCPNKGEGTRGMTPLHLAIRNNDMLMVLYLLRVINVDPNQTTYDKLSPEEFASGYDFPIILKVLLGERGFANHMLMKSLEKEMDDSDEELDEFLDEES